VLVAASAKGVCAISLGDDPEELLRDLQDRFPRASLIGGDESFEGYVAAAVGMVERPQSSFDLPLDMRGTAFAARSPRCATSAENALRRDRATHRRAVPPAPSRRSQPIRCRSRFLPSRGAATARFRYYWGGAHTRAART
jgi:AraC family transcriptional regulator of adaptative response/methylated-DNA-[protein]-cysteine methyltransferase